MPYTLCNNNNSMDEIYIFRDKYLKEYRVKNTNLLPPQGFGPEAKTRGGIIVSPAYTYKECVKYWCSMGINPDLMKLGARGGIG